MTIRDILCAERAALHRLDGELAQVEQQVASRNAAHLVSRARSMARATASLITEALAQQLDVAAHQDLARSMPGRAPIVDEEAARRALAELPDSVLAISSSAARLRLRQLNDDAGNQASAAMMTRLGWRENSRGYWQRPGFGAAAVSR